MGGRSTSGAVMLWAPSLTGGVGHASFDEPVRTQDKGWRQRQSEGTSRLHVQDQLMARGQFHRDQGDLGAAQDAIHLGVRSTNDLVDSVGAVEPLGFVEPLHAT